MIRNTLRPLSREILQAVKVQGKGKGGFATGGADRDYSEDTRLPPPIRDSRAPADAGSTSHAQELKTVKKEVEQVKKTMAQLDEELRLKLEDISGEGGNAGIEYEDGKAEGLKRGVKENMFRVI